LHPSPYATRCRANAVNSARFRPSRRIAWVTIDMVLWGFMTRFPGSLAHTSYRFVPALLGAVLFWDFMTRVMQGVTTAFFEDVWSRNFLNVFATPITMPEYITGLLVSSLVSSYIVLAYSIFAWFFATWSKPG
jgi:ABC-2 type transport system permease protein